MGFLNDLFKDREQERKQAIRSTMFEARRAIRGLERHSEELTQKRDQAWNEARLYMSKGQEALAKSKLAAYQSCEKLVRQIDRKVAVVSYYITNLEVANTCQGLTETLGKLGNLVNINPATVNTAFEKLSAGMDDIGMIDEEYDRIYGEQLQENGRSGDVPSMDDLLGALKVEAGGAISGNIPVSNQPASAQIDVKNENDYFDRMANIMNNKG